MPKKMGAKGRKINRMSRKPAHARYNAERRWERNKERKQARHLARVAKKQIRKTERFMRVLSLK